MTKTPGAVDERLDQKGREIPRGRLAARVADALDTGSVILTAGGGCGKTTVLDQALRDAPAVARFCIKYGTLVEFSY